MTFTVHSSRKHGEPKLSKPEQLQGIQQTFSEEYLPKKCTFPVFILEDKDQIWIKARDWFSPMFVPPDLNDIGKSQRHILEKYFPNQKLPRGKGFVYSDNYASVVLRCEAWICFDGVFKDADRYNQRPLFSSNIPTQIWILQKMLESIEKKLGFPEFELTCSNLERFFERVINRLVSDEKLRCSRFRKVV